MKRRRRLLSNEVYERFYCGYMEDINPWSCCVGSINVCNIYFCEVRMNIIEEIQLLLQANKLLKMLKEVMKMKNYKTTLVGLVGAIASVAYPLIAKGTVDAGEIIRAVVIAAVAFLAKDFDVSGTGA